MVLRLFALVDLLLFVFDCVGFLAVLVNLFAGVDLLVFVCFYVVCFYCGRVLLIALRVCVCLLFK